MNRDQFAGAWREAKGAIRKQWGKLTDDDLDQVEGDWEQLVGRIQREYGGSREEIERQLEGLRDRP